MANIAVWLSFTALKPVDFARLYFFNVGQGDAIYLRTPQGNDVLVDGGPGEAVLPKLGQAMPFLDRNIELVILTHPHADHVSGLLEILKRYEVKTVVVPDVVYESATYAAFLEALREKHIQTIVPKLGERIFLDEKTVFDVYYPLTGKFAKAPPDINDASIVGKLSFGKIHVMLTGDAGRDIEDLLLRLKLPLSSQILKVGHHGSRHSTSPEFLAAVHPEESVISVGKNSYGHPHPEVLGILQSQGTKLLRTDQRGDVSFQIYPDHIVPGK